MSATAITTHGNGRSPVAGSSEEVAERTDTLVGSTPGVVVVVVDVGRTSLLGVPISIVVGTVVEGVNEVLVEGGKVVDGPTTGGTVVDGKGGAVEGTVVGAVVDGTVVETDGAVVVVLGRFVVVVVGRGLVVVVWHECFPLQ